MSEELSQVPSVPTHKERERELDQKEEEFFAAIARLKKRNPDAHTLTDR